MDLFGWFKAFLPRRPEAPEAVMSREVSTRIAEKANELQRSLQVYNQAKDPFAAMLADLYNRDQVSRIWKNGSGS